MSYLLPENKAKELLKSFGVNVPHSKTAKALEEAKAAACEIGFPVALKIISPDIIHKTEAGGVCLGIASEEELEQKYNELLTRVREYKPDARLDGVLVESMAKPGMEVIVGAARDEEFGKVLMFGIGGVLVELLEDVSIRVIPITLTDAQEMIQETKGYRLLTGYRGRPRVDLDAIAKVLLAVGGEGGLIEQQKNILELDINPLIVYPDGCVAVDARIILEEGF